MASYVNGNPSNRVYLPSIVSSASYKHRSISKKEPPTCPETVLEELSLGLSGVAVTEGNSVSVGSPPSRPSSKERTRRVYKPLHEPRKSKVDKIVSRLPADAVQPTENNGNNQAPDTREEVTPRVGHVKFVSIKDVVHGNQRIELSSSTDSDIQKRVKEITILSPWEDDSLDRGSVSPWVENEETTFIKSDAKTSPKSSLLQFSAKWDSDNLYEDENTTTLKAQRPRRAYSARPRSSASRHSRRKRVSLSAQSKRRPHKV